MDLRHMRQFIAVAEELHFGNAARRLNMAQPPLSQSIRRLEESLGVTLFNRSRREVELTDAGRVYLAEARRTLVQAELARKMAVRAAASVEEVRVSFIGPALYRLLPALMLRFREAHPDIQVRLFEQTSPEQISGIVGGDYDIGFVTANIASLAQTETLLVERTGFLAVVPDSWDIADLDVISLDQLVEYPFIRPPERVIPEGPEPLSIFHGLGLTPNVTQEASQTNTTLSLVGVGVGCSIVMATATLAKPRGVKFIPIVRQQSSRRWEMAAAWPIGPVKDTTQAFLTVMRQELADNPQWLEPDHLAD